MIIFNGFSLWNISISFVFDLTKTELKTKTNSMMPNNKERKV